MARKKHPVPAPVYIVVGKYINVPEHLYGPIKYASPTINIEQLYIPKKQNDKYEKNLRIASNKHDLTGIRVFDKSEESIINLGFVSFFDIETGKNRFINTSSKKTRSAFSKYF